MEYAAIIGLLILAFAMGRSSKPTVRVVTREGELENAYNEGYGRGRLGPFGPSLDDLNLALHRQEGLVGAINDNYHDLKQAAKKMAAPGNDEPKAN